MVFLDTGRHSDGEFVGGDYRVRVVTYEPLQTRPQPSAARPQEVHPLLRTREGIPVS